MWNICSRFLRICPDHKLLEPVEESFVYEAVDRWAYSYERRNPQATELSIPDARICCHKTWRNIWKIDGPPYVSLLKPLDGNSTSDRRRQEVYAVVALGLSSVFSLILQNEKLSIDEMNHALQLACLYDRLSWVQKLIDCGASPLSKFYKRY